MTTTRMIVNRLGVHCWQYQYWVPMADGSVVTCPGPVVEMSRLEEAVHVRVPAALAARDEARRLEALEAQRQHDEVLRGERP